MNEQQFSRMAMPTRFVVMLAIVGGVALLLSGCAVGRNYKRPVINSPTNFRNASANPSTNSLADLQWWELYKDETLNSLVRTALTNNYDFRIRRAVEAYGQAVQLSMQRYADGKAAYSEVLEAQQQLFPSENSLARTELNQLLVIVQLYKALGGGWEEAK